MKKPVKITLIVCSCALFLFLLLPFLETSAPKNTSANGGDAQAEPQIFTSNPLTELVGRIARFFGKRQNGQTPNGRLSEDQANEQFGTPQEGTLYAAANTQEASSGSISGDPAAYANAYLQNEEGEWVLIPQIAPEGSTRGMHEINVKDNAYDRYVAQERQARFTPVMRQPAAKEEVPDSRLARIFDPVKRLFGGSKKPTAASALDTHSSDTLAAARKSGSSGLDKNKEKSANPFKRPSFDWTGFRNNPYKGMRPGGKDAAEAFLDLINPERALKETAEWLADIKYPNAETPQQQQAKEEFKRQQQEQDKAQFRQEMQSLLIQENDGKEPVNVLQDTTGPESCGDGSVKTKGACPLPEKNINGIQAATAAQFFEETGLHLPPAGITVVLNASEMPLLHEGDEEYIQKDEEKLTTLKFYEFMQKNCTDNCYWVATGGNESSELAKTIEAVGLKLKGDPLQRYNQYAKAFLEEQRQNNVPQETLEQLEKQLMEKKNPYTAYAQEDLQQLLQQTSDMLNQRANPQDAAVPFFTHAENAYDFYQKTNTPHVLFYGNGEAVNGAKGLNERANAFTSELAQFVNNAQNTQKKIKQNHMEDATKTMVTPAVQQIQEDLKNELDQFNKTNDLGTYQK